MNSFTNRLALETSPYLLQHANNPVDWHPWGSDAFAKAQAMGRLVLVSIGYSSCHWCHVMEHETFSNPEVAEYMNSHFINIKVDREERPDIDQIYMNAVQIINRSGGWPLNCFTLSNGKPFFGGTYFSPDNWLNILKNINEVWLSETIRIVEVADELAESITNSEVIKFKSNDDSTASSNTLKDYAISLKKLFDSKNGGIKGAPKFPMPGLLDFLLEYGLHADDNEVTDFVLLSLEKIAMGGIYDHLGGGFSRYSVDENWQIPHFEKMLYDNAQLISLYSKAYRLIKNELFKNVVGDTIAFILREMKSDNGSFFASYDADNDGKEGNYYTWTKGELEAILGDDAELFSVTYGVTAAGNFDGRNVLYRCTSTEELKSLFSIDCSAANSNIAKAKRLLLDARNHRVKPELDDKTITSWNALLVTAFVDAFVSFGDNRYLQAAKDCINSIESTHYSEGNLKRIYCKGKLTVDALLDDYANLINAYLSLYKVTLNQEWLTKGEKLVKTAVKNFFDQTSGMFFYTPSYQADLIARKMELTDGVIPSSGSVMAQNLFELGAILKDETYTSMSLQMLTNITEPLKHGGPYIFGWAKLLLTKNLPAIRIEIDSNIDIELLNKIQSNAICSTIYPVYSNGQSSDNSSASNQPRVKICIDKTCYPSATNPDYYIRLIKSVKLF